MGQVWWPVPPAPEQRDQGFSEPGRASGATLSTIMHEWLWDGSPGDGEGSGKPESPAQSFRGP